MTESKYNFQPPVNEKLVANFISNPKENSNHYLKKVIHDFLDKTETHKVKQSLYHIFLTWICDEFIEAREDVAYSYHYLLDLLNHLEVYDKEVFRAKQNNSQAN